jgi:hypothetical protein
MRRQPIACALLLCYLAACTSWHVEKGVSPLELISTEHPTAVRLTRADGLHIVLHEPRIAAGDSVAGFRDNIIGAPFSVAVSDVTQAAIRKVSASKTIGLVVGIPVGYLIIGVIIVSLSGGTF